MSFTDCWLLVGGAYCVIDQWLSKTTNGHSGRLSLGGGAHCGADQWLSRTINGHSLAAAHLGEGPTVVLTMAEQNYQRSPPLTVAWLGGAALVTKQSTSHAKGCSWPGSITVSQQRRQEATPGAGVDSGSLEQGIYEPLLPCD